MTGRTLSWGLAAWLTCGAIAAPPRSVPNFAGRWKLVPLSASPYDAGFAPMGRGFEVKQDRSTITITWSASFGDAKTRRTYRLDGVPTTVTVKAARDVMRRLKIKADWQDDVLVLTTEWPFHRRVETLSFDRQGDIVATSRSDDLFTRDGKLTVSSTGLITRTYTRIKN